MDEYRLPWVDRLAQAQWFDRFGFVAFAGGGCILIVAAKIVGVPALPVTLGAVTVMLVYAGAVWRSMAGRLRADQAGDNLYYLGLLYTLTGLAYAIFTFRPEASATALVEGFGIALATTIVGLMLRVFFSQVRSDLVEIEDRARMDLSDAATKLKAELIQIANEMNDFGRQTRQSLAEAVSGIEAGMVATVAKGTDSLTEMARKADAGVTSAFDHLSERAAALGGAVSSATEAVQEHAGSTRKWSQALDKVGPKLEVLASAAERLEMTATALQQQSAGSAEQVRSAGAMAEEASSILKGLNELVLTLQQRLLTVVDAQDSRIAAIEAAPVASAERVAAMIETIGQTVDAQIEKISGGYAAMLDGQLEKLRQTVTTAEGYNEQLAADLEKSRGYVAKVHEALVEVANNLARQVEPEGVPSE